jgi:hypothetical protein
MSPGRDVVFRSKVAGVIAAVINYKSLNVDIK